MSAAVTAIIVHWNQPESCLATVERFTALPEVASVIVVDNGSTEEHLDSLRKGLGSGVTLLEVGYNSGFGPAANHGWEYWLATATTEWSAIAPHDAIPASNTLSLMLEAADERMPSPGLLSADVGDGASPVVDHVFGPITRPSNVSTGFEPVDYPHGTLMMGSRRCLEEIGLFDERYFAYCEEADLGLRAKAAGFEVGLVRGALVTNPQVNSPAPLVDYLKERNTVLLVADHFGRRKALLRFALTLWHFGLGIVAPSRRGEYWSTRARVLAIRDIIRRSWGPPPPSLRGSTQRSSWLGARSSSMISRLPRSYVR